MTLNHRMRSALTAAREWLPGRAELALPAAGLYHYARENGPEKVRMHLRLDPAEGGKSLTGLLMINASQALHLNFSAACMAYLALEGRTEEQAVHFLTRTFRTGTNQARADYRRFRSQLDELARPEGACPVHELDLDILAPFSTIPSAPYRMDLALTYRCSNDCAHCYNARPRKYPELATSDWVRILDRLWELGIPHVVFTGGEPTVRDDLPELIAHAERNGQITGINTNGRRLRSPQYVQGLVEAGLDHIQITLESHDAAVHDQMVGRPGAWEETTSGLRNALGTGLYVMTNTTLLRHNCQGLEATLDYLADTGVQTVGLNALIYSGRGANVGSGLSEHELQPLLALARRKTEASGQRLIWYTPTQYCHFDPQQLQLGVKGCTAALYNMCVEPDGQVIPCQSYYRTLGSLLDDSWESIWEHPLALRLRERFDLPAKCGDCAIVAECRGGCPLYAGQEGDQAFNPLEKSE